MAPLQFAFYGQLWTTFAPKMTFSTLKIAFNICTRVKRHVHVQGPWRQLGINNMSSTVVQQNFSQLIPCDVCTNSLMRVYFFVSMEDVDSSCVEINECSFAYFNHIKRSSAHMATFRPSTPTFQILDSRLVVPALRGCHQLRDLVTQIVVTKYFMYLGAHLGVERSSWIHRSPNFVRKISSHWLNKSSFNRENASRVWLSASTVVPTTTSASVWGLTSQMCAWGSTSHKCTRFEMQTQRTRCSGPVCTEDVDVGL